MTWDYDRALKLLGLRSQKWNPEMRATDKCEVCLGENVPIFILIYSRYGRRPIKICRNLGACEFRKAVRS